MKLKIEKQYRKNNKGFLYDQWNLLMREKNKEDANCQYQEWTEGYNYQFWNITKLVRECSE